MENLKNVKGGSFLITSANPQDSFTPEKFTEEQRMIAEMCDEFLEKEVLPRLDELDAQEEDLMPSLLDRAAELGLLGAAFPEEYGGLGKDFVTATLINEHLGGGHSFAVALAAHNGIGSLPILYYGTDEQKEQYIPKLASGKMKGAYALTEPGSGSDALSAKTTASLTADGTHYLLNGQKIWITNAGFADIFTVFAQLNEKGFSAFLVEKDAPGLSFGDEEDKMGIKGSSTRPLYFENCQIPVRNLLGTAGRGHVIAFNILNIGRLKLCAAALGGAKAALRLSLNYAQNRIQFGKPIAQFGAIQQKLAEMAIRIFATESVLYRTAFWIENKEKELAKTEFDQSSLPDAAEEFAIECAMLKVIGSECLDYVVDEGVQIHGGNGFMNDYNISRAYRDSRINRIFEGTNEINRLLALDMYLKRALKGRLDLLTPAKEVANELLGIPDLKTPEGIFGIEQETISRWKKAILMIAGAAVQKKSTELEHEQELLMNLANMLMDTFQAESMLLRAIQMKNSNHPLAETGTQMMRTFLQDAADRISHEGKNALNAFVEGDDAKVMLLGLKRFTKTTPFNTKDARRQIAQYYLNNGI